ncbi:MAG: hypothetical protein U0350_29400 [Caldilineaceae bacterium]
MVRKPTPAEEYITILDNKNRKRVQHVEYIVLDIRGEQVYITADGLTYATDSLVAKDFHAFVEELERIPTILSSPEIVIHDHTSPDDTLIYYKHLRIAPLGITQLMAVVVKWRQGLKFFYNMHPQESEKVKGYREVVAPEVWYLAAGRSLKEFGLKSA